MMEKLRRLLRFERRSVTVLDACDDEKRREQEQREQEEQDRREMDRRIHEASNRLMALQAKADVFARTGTGSPQYRRRSTDEGES
jgi:hypothetical protein